MKNKFNRLTSKEWLPFQKSWFKFEDDAKFYSENIRFFSKAHEDNSYVLYDGHSAHIIREICDENKLRYINYDDYNKQEIQFAIFDLRNEISEFTSLKEYLSIKQNLIEKVTGIYEKVEHRRFISVIIKNVQVNSAYYPFAWDIAKELSSIYSIKDEKIGCISTEKSTVFENCFSTALDGFYALYFRKDENSDGIYKATSFNIFKSINQNPSILKFERSIPYWFILKPQPRNKNEILHPAKYPEDLVEMFIKTFSKENDLVFDPMSGTGSTQMGALKLNRKGYGTELSDFFTEIANNRCKLFCEGLKTKKLHNYADFKILNLDARNISKKDFPEIDYLITSPPYWDMLNMKGAENQAKRIKKGLQTNYSDNNDDLGNLADYNRFLNELIAIYLNLAELIKPGSFLTIVVKNIKKKGKNYPFAWDLSNALQQKLILLPEVFWCQDDISIAPYGYGNTWVSNTFHQYCLTFQKPLN